MEYGESERKHRKRNTLASPYNFTGITLNTFMLHKIRTSAANRTQSMGNNSNSNTSPLSVQAPSRIHLSKPFALRSHHWLIALSLPLLLGTSGCQPETEAPSTAQTTTYTATDTAVDTSTNADDDNNDNGSSISITAVGSTPELTGGETTVWASGANAFSLPSANLADAEKTRFFVGNSFFKRNWVQAPASTTARDGLGPHFIARSCSGCHALDGRGAPPDFNRGLQADNKPNTPNGSDTGSDTDTGHAQPVALLMRLSIPGTNERGEPNPDPVYGGQLNNAGIRGVKAEGKIAITHTPISGQFADGTTYTLYKPHYRITDLGYGPMHPDVMIGPRIAPQVIGMGLLEAIPAEDIEANVAAQQLLNDPLNKTIKGKANYVWDVVAQKKLIGRIGWKANVASVAHQTAGAFVGDIGITSMYFPNQDCMPAQKDCLAAPSGAEETDGGIEHEIRDELLGQVIFYQNTLAPAARRNINDPQVIQGEKIFHQAQCAQCHRPSYTTGKPLYPQFSSMALSNQSIHPYTDLLLHDMGEDLADGRPDFLASGSEWKTPPLWGIGLIPDVNKHQFLMHDGRANGVMEAVLWHGGEALASRNYVLQLDKKDRDALVAFVNSL